MTSASPSPASTSDHGEMLGDHSMMGKRAFYEESARVPFLLSVPWLTQTQKRIDGVFGQATSFPPCSTWPVTPCPKRFKVKAWQVH